MLTLTSLYAYVLLYLVGVQVNLEDQRFFYLSQEYYA